MAKTGSNAKPEKVDYARLLKKEHDRLETGRGARGNAWKPDPGNYAVQFTGISLNEYKGKTSGKPCLLAIPEFVVLRDDRADADEAVIGRAFSGDACSSDVGSEFTVDILFGLAETITGEAPEDLTAAIATLEEEVAGGHVLSIEVKRNKKGYTNVYVNGLDAVDEEDPDEDEDEDE